MKKDSGRGDGVLGGGLWGGESLPQISGSIYSRGGAVSAIRKGESKVGSIEWLTFREAGRGPSIFHSTIQEGGQSGLMRRKAGLGH